MRYKAQRRFGFWLAIFAGLLALAPPLAADDAKPLRGVALVVGNGDYAHLPDLPNPTNDADAIEALLADLGFDSVRRTDRDADTLARDLQRFAEDAADADVAILYYSGHGIEAGGENFLVPVDADLSALDAAGEKLVPISALIDKLKATVPVAIVLLDACRNNPFPPGSMLTPVEGGEPVAVTASGLGTTRGAVSLASASAPAEETFGTVLAFAAEPGKVALDGDAGGNSPYATAILRHFSAMAGEEFGTVMRMVAEEVYLSTEGRQHPWVNESLRRLLYLGGEAPELDADAAKILGERRQLLVRIAELPGIQRSQAETLARGGGLPMSVVFAMLRALNVDPNADPATVEARLREEVAEFAAARQVRASLQSPDPEIQRLSGLADEAETQGALVTADGFREAAKARVASLRATRQQQIAELKQRVAEDAAVYARSAETKKLMFRHAEAARDYAEAAVIVAELDAAQAAVYRQAEIDAWLIDGELRGDRSSLAAAEARARDAATSLAAGPPTERARINHRLGLAIFIANRFENDPARARQGATVLETALADAEALPAAERGRIVLDAGRAFAQLGAMTGDTAMLTRGADLLRQAETLATGAADKPLAVEAMFRRMQANYVLWTMAPDPALIVAITQGIEAMTPFIDGGETDALSGRYLVSASSLAVDAALRLNTPDALKLAGEINAEVAGMFDADRFPLIRAEADFITARIGLEWAERFGDISALPAALVAQDSALAILTEAGTPTEQATFQKALILISIGTRTNDIARLDEALAVLATLSSGPEVRSDPVRMQAIAFQTARIDATAAALSSDIERLRKAVTALHGLRGQASPDPFFAIQVLTELGKASVWLAAMSESTEETRDAVALMSDAIGRYDAMRAAETNPVPFTQVFQVYSVAATDLALKTEAAPETDEAIAVARRLHTLYASLDYGPGRIHAANTLAFLMAQSLRLSPDPARLAEAETFAAEALSGASAIPQYAAYFRNAACEVATERARHDRSIDKAKAALADCQSAATGLAATGDQAAMAQSQAAVTRATALVADLGG